MLILTLLSCFSRFDKYKWRQKNDIEFYQFRDNMLKDLLSNYKLNGLSYSQLIDLLGKPDRVFNKDSDLIYYSIVTNYGRDIDPIYAKYLIFKLNKDSIVIDYKIKEWKK
jgi:hypothetical protein